MPLQQRIIEPVYVSRSTLPLPQGDIKPLTKSIAYKTGQGKVAHDAAAANIPVPNELECLANGTLANLIRQLSTLSRQAEELLTGVFEDASKLVNRTTVLQQRMNALASKMETIDQSADIPIVLRDPTSQQETFCSDMTCDQQVLSKEQMPTSIQELYDASDKPPPLGILNPYRDDGKDGLKFYTDPMYFFELWKKDMMKETIRSQQAGQVQRQQSQSISRTLQNPKKFSHNPTQASAHQFENHPRHQEQPNVPQNPHQIRQQIISANGSYTSSTSYIPSYDYSQDMGSQIQGQGVSSELDRSTEGMTQYMQRTTLNDSQSRIQQIQQQQQQQYEIARSQLRNQQLPPMVHNQAGPIYHQQMSTHQAQAQYMSASHAQSQLPPPPSVVSATSGTTNNNSISGNINQQIETPPPPPALSPLPPVAAPPPPPPPPAPPAPAPPASTADQPMHNTTNQPLAPKGPVSKSIIPTAAELQQKHQQLRKTIPVQRDNRKDLLNAIKQGITLRRVEDSKRRVEAEKKQSMGNDVASILARRVAMQVSDSDDNGEDDDNDDNDNDWNDSGDH